MGFYLWLDGDLAWAQGTYEYRAMGAAVISSTDLFCPRDFDPKRHPPKFATLIGQFASLGHLNLHLRTTARRASAPRSRCR